jgi:hypothetical protein
MESHAQDMLEFINSSTDYKRLTPNKKSLRLQGKNFFLTYPKCYLTRDIVLSLLLEKLPDIVYVLIALESHKDGTPHIHVYLSVKTKLRSSDNKFFDIATFHGNYQTVRDPDDVIAYVRKSDISPLEHGEYKSYNKVRGETQSEIAKEKRKVQNNLILSTPLQELVLNGDVSIYSVDSLYKSINRYKMETQIVPKYMPKECIWIYGSPGIGKSRYVRDNFDNVFLKSQNKWWDGYKQQSVVLLDDFDLGGECLGHYLKIWGDCYPFNAEVKGGTCQPVYDKFFITSNYLPNEIFCKGNDCSKWDPTIVEAIGRRFVIMTIKDNQLINYDN